VSRPAILAERLYQARAARRLSREALSRLTGVSSRSIDRYEKGEQAPSSDVLLRLAQNLGVSASWLVGEEGQPDQLGPPAQTPPRPNLFSLVSSILALSPEDRAALLRLLQSEPHPAG
jgi:transcriptional regulator with XRE-family HTH domain